MKILLITPLYPPDIAEPAPYVKELGTRLSSNHTVTILAYNHIPETIHGVTIRPIEKASILPVRLFRFYRSLHTLAFDTDVIYAQNGPSVELPLLLLTFFTTKSIFIRLGDNVPLMNVREQSVYRTLLSHILKRVRGVVTHADTHANVSPLLIPIQNGVHHVYARPLMRPEVLPFTPYPEKEFTLYEKSWSEHVTLLTKLFTSV
jgi:hypothetical protein